MKINKKDLYPVLFFTVLAVYTLTIAIFLTKYYIPIMIFTILVIVIIALIEGDGASGMRGDSNSF